METSSLREGSSSRARGSEKRGAILQAAGIVQSASGSADDRFKFMHPLILGLELNARICLCPFSSTTPRDSA